MLFPQSKIGNLKSKMSFYDPVRPHQHIRRDRQADLLGGFQIDDEFKLRRLFYWEVGWLGAFENLST